DFEGQRMAEQLMNYTLYPATVIAFIVGFAFQSLRLSFSILGAAVLLLCLLVLPPWPYLNQHPVPWLPSKASREALSFVNTPKTK
ncbi:hypothetical protein BOTBODRAFT_115236, partial [Botryobasidium botryosum FD-172 SS1]